MLIVYVQWQTADMCNHRSRTIHHSHNTTVVRTEARVRTRAGPDQHQALAMLAMKRNYKTGAYSTQTKKKKKKTQTRIPQRYSDFEIGRNGVLRETVVVLRNALLAIVRLLNMGRVLRHYGVRSYVRTHFNKRPFTFYMHTIYTYITLRGVGTGVRFTLLLANFLISLSSSSSSSLPNGFIEVLRIPTTVR